MFTFGGGYVVIPMMEKYFVIQKNYLSKDELYELATISQTSPGAIAINLAVLVGYRINKKTGAIVSGLAGILPSFIILSIVSYSYSAFATNPMVNGVLRGMEAGVAAIIVDLVITMFQQIAKKSQKVLLIIPIVTFVLNYFFNLHPMLLIAGTILLMLFLLRDSGGEKQHDLSVTCFLFFPNRFIQYWWWLCNNFAHSKNTSR